MLSFPRSLQSFGFPFVFPSKQERGRCATEKNFLKPGLVSRSFSYSAGLMYDVCTICSSTMYDLTLY